MRRRWQVVAIKNHPEPGMPALGVEVLSTHWTRHGARLAATQWMSSPIQLQVSVLLRSLGKNPMINYEVRRCT